MQREIDAIATEIEDDLTNLRHDIHDHPELAGEERRTSALVADRLRSAGLEVTTGVGGYGVVAVVNGEGDGPTVAYRADMDAVMTDDVFGGVPASHPASVAHLCGHDMHTAIGVGIAEVFARLRKSLRGRIVFFFQPAEETLEGARAMIDDGVLNKTSPQEIYALHCAPLQVGQLAISPGLPGQDRFEIEISGSHADAHSAELATTINSLSTVTHPQTAAEGARLIQDLLTPGGRLDQFVFARAWQTTSGDRARVQASLRAWPDSQYAVIRKEVEREVAAIPRARVSDAAQPFPAMVCSPELNQAARAYLSGAFGSDTLSEMHGMYPFNGEDFALFLQQVPGAMLYLGVADPPAGVSGAPHTPDFAADDRAIAVGVRAMTGLLASRVKALA